MEIIYQYYHTTDRRWGKGALFPSYTKSTLGRHDIPIKDIVGRTLYIYSGKRNKEDSIKAILSRIKQLRQGMTEEQVVHILKPTYYGQSLNARTFFHGRDGEKDFYMNDPYQDLLLINGKLDNMHKALFIDIVVSDVPFSYPDVVPKLLVNGEDIEIQIYIIHGADNDQSESYRLRAGDGSIELL